MYVMYIIYVIIYYNINDKMYTFTGKYKNAYIYNHIELKISHPLPVSMVHISVKSHHTAKPKRKYPIDSLSYSESNFKESFEVNDCFTWFHPFTAANSAHSGMWTGQADRRWRPVQFQLLMRMEKSCVVGTSELQLLAIVDSLLRERLHRMFVVCL